MNRKKHAFGLVETIMASGILIIVIGAITLVSSVVLKSSRQTSEDLIANYLQYEVFESARQIRGTNYIDEDNTTNWNNGLVSTTNNSQYVNLGIIPVSGFPIFNASTNTGETITKRGVAYKRVIYIDKLTENKLKVTVTISWGNGKVRTGAIILTNYEQGF